MPFVRSQKLPRTIAATTAGCAAITSISNIHGEKNGELSFADARLSDHRPRVRLLHLGVQLIPQ